MKEITMKILSYCEIPGELTSSHWINDYQSGCYVKYSIPREDEWNDFDTDALDEWIKETYPILLGQSFLIEIDY